ncbi:hypothetical protein SDC9_192712 [bioreactor metagenome]|uniref:Uncharacterized protein n=1 Tax=bioreactor metagenome TaxID=1076179 RepID=A0A645I1J3_9ZZZZ
MQADIPVPHGQEGRGQHQRNGDAHHQSGTYAQADEGDRHDDQNRLGQRLDESLHRALDGVGLAGRLADLDADRQVGLQGGDPGFPR